MAMKFIVDPSGRSAVKKFITGNALSCFAESILGGEYSVVPLSLNPKYLLFDFYNFPAIDYI